jgi:site-specific DNA recombinase
MKTNSTERFKSLLPKRDLKINSNSAIIYTRVSTAEQAETNYSLETQLKHCLDYAAKNGIKVKEQFGGTYESAKTDGRKEFNRMIDYIKNNNGSISFLIVYSLDRFSRTGEHAMVLAGELKRLGVSLVSVTQPTDTNSDMGVFYQNLLLLFGKLDNDMRRSKTISGMKEMLRSGYFCGKAPIGYRNIPGAPRDEAIVLDEKSKWIKKAFEWKLQEKISNKETAARLNIVGIHITSKRVTEILRNPFYCGILIGNILGDEIVEGKHPVLISKDTFWRVQEIMDGNHHGYSQEKENELFPLKHFVICDQCNTPFTAYKVIRKNLDYYKCNKIGCRCNKNAKYLHDKFVQLLDDYSIEKRMINPIKHTMSYLFHQMNKDKIQTRKQYLEALKKTEEKIEKIQENRVLGEISNEMYQKFILKYEAEKAGIENQISQNTPDLSNLENYIESALQIASNLPTLWVSKSFRTQRRLQELVFPEGIRYNKENDCYRTNRVNSIFSLIPYLKRVSEKNKSGLSTKKMLNSAYVPRTGIEPAQP